MKKSYKTKTGTFGTDAERYVSRLFGLMINPNGSCRPDLISSNGKYSPKLSIEVKSGRHMKGILVDYQLRYAITTEQDYNDTFGARRTQQQGFLFDKSDLYPKLGKEPVAYYYDVVDRIDGIESSELNKPFSAIQLKWGDQFIVPHEYGFWAFAVSASRRSHKEVRDIANELREVMKADIDGIPNQPFYWRKKDSNSWQDLHGRDIFSIHQEDEQLATEQGRERIKMMKEVYPEVDKLRKMTILGPNGTKIYALVKDEHFDIFNKTLRETIRKKKKILERVDMERRQAQSLLAKINFVSDDGLFGNGDLAQDRLSIGLTKGQITLLERLCHWRRPGEKDELEEECDVPF